MQCKVCGVTLPGAQPCGIAPRYYVNDWGFIVGIIPGCPSEPDKKPDYLPEDILPRMSKIERDEINELAKEIVDAKSYEDLWASRYRENYHLNFDAKNRLGIWSAANEGGLHYSHQGRVRGSQGSSS